MKPIALVILALIAGSAAAGAQAFVGVITDDMCGKGDHSQMRMGSTDAECTIACISEHDAQYILYDGQNAYRLSDQRGPERFAGRKVRITGTLDAATKTIRVASIRSAR